MTELPEISPTPRGEMAGDWCRRIAEGSLTEAEVAEFEAWMAADDDNRAAFDRATFIWRALDGRAAPPELVSVRMDALSALGEAAQPAPPPRRMRWIIGGAVAAMVALVLLVSFAFWPQQPSEYSTGRGERRVVMLGDGSRLSLDAASRVEVRYTDDRRSLTLVSGRAKFDVARNALRPFSVQAGDKLVVATGTSFSVEMLKGKVNVTLYEGHVAVLDARTRRPAVLGKSAQGMKSAEQLLVPGKELSMPETGAARLTDVDAGRSAAWEGGQLSFTDEPLGAAVERMNRYSRVQIRIGDRAAGDIAISGVFNGDDTEGFIAGVTGVFPVRSTTADGNIVLSSANPK